MDRRTTIVLVGGAGAVQQLAQDLTPGGFDVRSADDAVGDPDLVLIDAEHSPDVITAVRDCRHRWPAPTTTVLVLGAGDPGVSLAALEAGATNAVLDANHGPMLAAHVYRAVRSGDMLRAMVARERRHATRDGLAVAAADVARPLGDLVDKLEVLMAHAPADAALDELLELASRAVDAVDRLRRLATAADIAPAPHDSRG